MAIIFSKASGTEQSVLLQPREAFYYPFNLGVWNEIRVGMFVSWVSGNSNTGFYGTENLNASNGGLINQAFFGFKDNSQLLPGQSGGFFFGLSNNTTTGPNLDSGNLWFSFDTTNKGGQIFLYDPNFGIYSQNNDTNPFYLTTPQNYTGLNATGNAASFWAIDLKILGGIYTFTHYFNSDTTAIYTDLSVTGLRNVMTIPPSTGSIRTGFFTSSLSLTGTIYPSPSGIFLYFPFLNNSLLIHSLVIERYA